MNLSLPSLVTRPGRLLAGLALLTALSACGYKGPLYLPPPPPAPDDALTQPPTTPLPAAPQPASQP